MSTPFNLRDARLNEGLSQRALAEEVGVSRETIRLLEQGIRPENPRPAVAKRIADRFGIKVTDLMARADDEEPKEAAA